jgi:sucrose phosphorylase
VLAQWARALGHMGPRATYLNITATHDGIGMRPAEGLLAEAQREELCRLAKQHGGDITGKQNADGTVSVYELNITYFDALNDPRGPLPLSTQIDRFILSQAVPMAMMGIPAFYLPSLLGSRNAGDLVRQTGRARSINRSVFDARALSAELGDPESLRARVCSRLRQLLAIRATLPAFHPDAAQEIPDFGPQLFVVRRHDAASNQTIIACHNISSENTGIALPGGAWRDAITKRECRGADILQPYSVSWFVKQ